MDFVPHQRAPKNHLPGIGFVIVLHIIIIWALVTGLARKAVEFVAKPLETKLIAEVAPPPENLPPPPPPPKMLAPPPPFIPPPEINVQVAPTPSPAAITAVSTASPPVATPAVAEAPKAPVRTAPVVEA